MRTPGDYRKEKQKRDEFLQNLHNGQTVTYLQPEYWGGKTSLNVKFIEKRGKKSALVERSGKQFTIRLSSIIPSRSPVVI